MRPEGVAFLTPAGEPIEREVTEVDWDEETAEKGGYETFMLKEIHEQADAVAETIADRTVRADGVDLGRAARSTRSILRNAKRIVIVACGTSYHAGLVGRYAIEEWARMPVEMDIASEYRYRNPVVGPGDLVIGITQSGETADTLAAMRLARERGATVLAVTNVMGSQATRDADGVLYTRAGLEISVAATKTFVCQVAVMYLLALRLAELRGTLAASARRTLVADLKRMPHCIGRAARDASTSGVAARSPTRHWRRTTSSSTSGRHVGLPVALEGALKLKEISYIATDAYAAGEMKHGPIALLDERTPVVTVATDSPVLEKVVSNMQEVRARGAHVIAVATEGNDDIGEHAEEVLRVPATDWMLQPLLAVIPLQLLAYRDRAPPRAERRPAAQPREDRHRRVDAAGLRGSSPAWRRPRPAGDRPARAGAGAPARAWPSGCSPTGERAYAAGKARPGQHLAARFCAKEAVAKALAWRRGARGTSRSSGQDDGAPASRCTAPLAARARAGRRRCSVSLTHTRGMAGAVAVIGVTAPGLGSTRCPTPSAMRATDRWAIEERGDPVARAHGARRARASRGLVRRASRRRGRSRSSAARATTAATASSPRGCCASGGREVRVLLVRAAGGAARRRARRTSSALPVATEPFAAERLEGAAGDRRRAARHRLRPARRASRAAARIAAHQRRGRAGGRRRRPQRRRRLDRRGRRRRGARGRDRDVRRRQAGPVDQPGQGARGRGAASSTSASRAGAPRRARRRAHRRRSVAGAHPAPHAGGDEVHVAATSSSRAARAG